MTHFYVYLVNITAASYLKSYFIQYKYHCTISYVFLAFPILLPLQITAAAPVDVIDPERDPLVVPRPVRDPDTGDDGITDTSAEIMFTLPTEINMNGPVDRLALTGIIQNRAQSQDCHIIALNNGNMNSLGLPKSVPFHWSCICDV